MFVLTSMSTEGFHQQADDLGLSGFFTETYSGVLDKRDVISSIVKSHKIDRSCCVFVGDMTHDVETAQYGGIYSAAVLTGYNHRELLESAQPTILVQDLKELQLQLEQSGDWKELFCDQS